MARTYTESDVMSAHTRGFLEGQRAERAKMRSRGKPATMPGGSGGGSSEDIPITQRILNSVPASSKPQTLNVLGWTGALGLPTRGKNAAQNQQKVRMGFTNLIRNKHPRISVDKEAGTYTVNPA